MIYWPGDRSTAVRALVIGGVLVSPRPGVTPILLTDAIDAITHDAQAGRTPEQIVAAVRSAALWDSIVMVEPL